MNVQVAALRGCAVGGLTLDRTVGGFVNRIAIDGDPIAECLSGDVERGWASPSSLQFNSSLNPVFSGRHSGGRDAQPAPSDLLLRAEVIAAPCGIGHGGDVGRSTPLTVACGVRLGRSKARNHGQWRSSDANARAGYPPAVWLASTASARISSVKRALRAENSGDVLRV